MISLKITRHTFKDLLPWPLFLWPHPDFICFSCLSALSQLLLLLLPWDSILVPFLLMCLKLTVHLTSSSLTFCPQGLLGVAKHKVEHSMTLSIYIYMGIEGVSCVVELQLFSVAKEVQSLKAQEVEGGGITTLVPPS